MPDATPPRPKVLVLLAAYNGSKWIAQQIDSIVRQRQVDLHLIVRDDGSKDNTVAAVRRFADRVELIPGKPSGSAAQNFLCLIREASAAGCDFVALADQDDLWDEDKLIRACHVLASQGAVGYSSPVIAFWDDGRRRVLRQKTVLTASDYLFEGAGQGCTFVLRADFYRRVRDFFMKRADLMQPIHYHDWAIYALARSWNLGWAFDSRPTMKYRQREDNDTGAKYSWSGLKKRVGLIKCGWYGGQVSAITRLCLAAEPANPIATQWQRILYDARGWRRTLEVTRFCFRGGRRKRTENAVLLFSSLAGWM